MPRMMRPEPCSGAAGSGSASLPRSCRFRSRWAQTALSVTEAISESAPVTRSSGQTAAMSAMPMARLARRFATRRRFITCCRDSVAEDAGVRRHGAGGGIGGVRPLLDQQSREVLVGGNAVAQVTAVAEERGEQRVGGGIALARFGEGDEAVVLAPVRVLAPALPAESERRLIRRQGRPCRFAPFRRYVHGRSRVIMQPSPGRRGRVRGRISSCRRSWPTESIFTTS